MKVALCLQTLIFPRNGNESENRESPTNSSSTFRSPIRTSSRPRDDEIIALPLTSRPHSRSQSHPADSTCVNISDKKDANKGETMESEGIVCAGQDTENEESESEDEYEDIENLHTKE